VHEKSGGGGVGVGNWGQQQKSMTEAACRVLEFFFWGLCVFLIFLFFGGVSKCHNVFSSGALEVAGGFKLRSWLPW